jgi:serine protease Do
VIGVNTLINTGPGGAYGFAIPINQVRNVAETLIKDGRMRYAYLGIQMDFLRGADSAVKDKLPSSAPKEAVLVAQVTPGSPAARAGVRPGDVITKIDERQVEVPQDLSEYVSTKPIGSAVTLAYFRDGRPGTVKVTLGEFPSSSELAAAESDVRKEDIGVSLQDLTPEIGRFLELPPGTRGAIVAEVVPGSRAARGGLREEDVILEVNRKPVQSAAEAAAALKADPAAAQVLRVRRGGATRFVTVPGR